MKNKGIIFILFTAVISGFSIFINKFGVKGIDSTLFTFTKNLIVAIFLLAIILGFSEFDNLKRLSKRQWSSLVLVGFVGGSIPFVLFFRGLQMTNGAVGSFIHKTMFIFVAILATLFLRERLNKKVFIPAVFLLGGNFLLLRITNFEYGLGALSVLIATLFWSLENVISKHLLKAIEPKVLAFGRLFFGSIFIIVYMALTNKLQLISQLTLAQFSWILISAPFLLLYVITWYTGLKYVKATTATSILLLGSPITALLSFVFLGVSLSVLQAVGMLLIIVGIISMVLLIEKKPHYRSVISIA